jgi:hypothetical protein
MQNNWYANYERYLSEGWKYQELNLKEMKKLANSHPQSPRLLNRKSGKPRCDVIKSNSILGILVVIPVAEYQ